MKRAQHVLLLASLWAFLAGCSIEVSEQSPPVNTLPPPSQTATPTGQPATLPDATTPAEEEAGPAGLLYFVGIDQEQQKLLTLNMATGEEAILFEPPENAWLSEVAVSPDGSQLVLAYAPPPPEGEVQFGFTDLYLMPADASQEPMPLLLRADLSEAYFNVTWPTEEYIYFSHVAPTTDDLGTVIYSSQIERLRYPQGDTELLVPAASWPRLSYDGAKLAYVNDELELIVAEPDGSNPKIALGSDVFEAVDAPLFSRDGEYLYFSAVGTPSNTAAGIAAEPISSLWEQLLGVRVASAHGVPSDWWRTPAVGNGGSERLTDIEAIGLYGDFNLDGSWLAFISSSGVYLMRPDGGDVQQIREIVAIGTIDWVP
jgi:Tol biopolymer transport system component